VEPGLREGVEQPAFKSVREQLERILSSPDFKANDRRKAFLRYITEESLAGRADRLKGYSIAVSVFDRDESFDPQTDPVVRLEARRLRRELEHYYLTAGRDDPIRVDIPKGAYEPIFAPVTSPPDQSERNAGPPERPTATGERRRSVRIAIALGALVAVAWTFAALRTPDPALAGKPFVAVFPLEIVGNAEINAELAAGYTEAVVANLTTLSGLSVMALHSAASIMKEALPLRTMRDEQGVSHVLRGTFLTQSETVRINVQLIDTETERVVWAESFDGNLNDLFGLEDELANRIAAVLSVTIDPDESRRIYLRHTSSREAIVLMRHATIAINPPNERGRIESARGLHQRTIGLDPSFAGGYAGMSQVHSYMVLFEHSRQPEEDLKNAIEFAREAIKLDGSFGMGHSMLGLAYSLAGQTDLALAEVRRAVALTPSDPLSYQWLSGVLLLSGRYDEAATAMLEALRLDPIEPGTPYLNILGMAYFNGEQYEFAIEAFERNRQKGGPDAPNMEAYRAATYAALGRETEAREVIANLNVRPGEISPENWIRRWTPSQAHAERTIAALHGLGMKNRDGTSTGESRSPAAAGTTE
jgi:TolB-like protein/tetratricopeptide (TPR) repeat protein